MRNLAVKLVMWLCDRYAINVVDEARFKLNEDQIAKANRWREFINEEGGLLDFIEALRRQGFEQAAETPVDETETLRYWAMSDRNLRRIKGMALSIVQSGELEEERDRKKSLAEFGRVPRTFEGFKQQQRNLNNGGRPSRTS